MDSGDYRPGTYAVYRGHAYKTGGDRETWPRITLIRTSDGDPVPDGLEPYPSAPDQAYFVHPEQLEKWYRTNSQFRWKNALFGTIGIKAGEATGEYRGADGPFPELQDLEQVERYVFIGSFPIYQITDLTEERIDLLEQWLAEQQRFAAANWYRNGTFTTYRGFTYGAYPSLSQDGRIRLLKGKHDEPIPEGLDQGARGEFGQEYLAEPDQVEQWSSAKWTFLAAGLFHAPFVAVGMHQGEIIGVYTGTDEEIARKYLKLSSESNPPEYYRVFPVSAAEDLTEHREDLLARWKEEHGA